MLYQIETYPLGWLEGLLMQYSTEIKLKLKYLNTKIGVIALYKRRTTNNEFWNFPLDQISNVSTVMLCLVAEGWGKEVSCGNVPVKNDANCFLVQKANSIPFHGLGI